MKQISRRNILKGSLIATGGASLVGFPQLFGLAQDEGSDTQTILNLAATAETFACASNSNFTTNYQPLIAPMVLFAMFLPVIK